MSCAGILFFCYALVEKLMQRWEACRVKLREIIPVNGIWIERERCTRRDEVVRMEHFINPWISNE